MKERPRFHAARLEDSDRLRQVLVFLQRRGIHGATTWELAQECRVTNPTGVLSELRANGVEIRKEYVGKSANGRTVNRYVYVGKVA